MLFLWFGVGMYLIGCNDINRAYITCLYLKLTLNIWLLKPILKSRFVCWSVLKMIYYNYSKLNCENGEMKVRSEKLIYMYCFVVTWRLKILSHTKKKMKRWFLRTSNTVVQEREEHVWLKNRQVVTGSGTWTCNSVLQNSNI